MIRQKITAIEQPCPHEGSLGRVVTGRRRDRASLAAVPSGAFLIAASMIERRAARCRRGRRRQ